MTDDLTDFERNILENLDEHGWFCTSVFDPDGNEPSFCYSVGFSRTLGCSEFIMFGLHPELMHSMIWEIFRQIKDGRPVKDDALWSGLLEGYDCALRAVHSTNIVPDWFSSAIWFWSQVQQRSEPLSAMQIVWPGSTSGKFPWEADCSQDVRDAQIPLWLPNRGLH